jgi:IS5 family transposase
MVHFRKRFDKDILNEINERIAKEAAKPKSDDDNNKPNKSKSDASGSLPTGNEGNEAEKGKNVGKLILDATCTPADIHYPTDIWLLNEAREALEEIIDVLHEPHIGQCVKPRTYRESARKKYLNVEKKKKLTAKKIRKAIGQQLRYIRRDLQIIEKLVEKSPLKLLNKRQYRNLLVSQEIYRQQLKMYQAKKHQVED